jgi:hypothetical protein
VDPELRRFFARRGADYQSTSAKQKIKTKYDSNSELK